MDKIIKKIINDALWAPTADNMQNWKIDSIQNSYYLSIDESIEKHPLDPFDQCMTVSFGMFIECLIISASNYNYSIQYDLISTENKVKFEFIKNDSVIKSDLINSIKERRTYRGLFTDKSISDEIKNELLETNNSYNSKISFIQNKSPAFLYYLKRVEKVFFGYFKGIYETLKWVNFDKINFSKTGMNFENAGINKFDAVLLKTMFKYKKMLELLFRIIIKNVLFFKFKAQLKSNQDYILFSVSKNDDRLAYFEVGRHAARCWLKLVKGGVSAQPLTLSSMSGFNLSQPSYSELVGENSDLFIDGVKVLRKAFDLKEEDLPLWMFRIGYPQSSVKLNSNRKTIDDLI